MRSLQYLSLVLFSGEEKKTWKVEQMSFALNIWRSFCPRNTWQCLKKKKKEKEKLKKADSVLI